MDKHSKLTSLYLSLSCLANGVYALGVGGGGGRLGVCCGSADWSLERKIAPALRIAHKPGGKQKIESGNSWSILPLCVSVI